MPDVRGLLSENAALREQLAEAQAVLAAARSGEVDALMVGASGSEKVFTLEGAEAPYRAFVEAMHEGAATVDANGAVLYGNAALAGLLKKALKKLIGSPVREMVVFEDRDDLDALLRSSAAAATQRELRLMASDGACVPALFAAAPLRRDGERDKVALVVSDLRERQHGEAIRKMLDQAALLSTLVENLHSSLAWQEAYAVIGRDVPRLLPDTVGALFVFDDLRVSASIAAPWGEPAALRDGWTPGDCQSVRRGHFHRGPESARAENCGHFTGAPPQPYVCVPLSAQGELIGVLHVQRRPPLASSFLDAEMYLVKAVAQHAALALANLGLRDKLREQAFRDNLTGLYNRHHEREWLEQELRRAARYGRRTALIMVDIDNFKRVNDTFGHDAGDLVLQAFAAVLKRGIRDSDIACRHGGEEFVLLLSEVSIDDAMKKAEVLRTAVKRLDLTDMGQPLGGITASFGVAVYPDHAGDAESLLRAADAALYRAKDHGRDRVAVATPREPAPRPGSSPWKREP